MTPACCLRCHQHLAKARRSSKNRQQSHMAGVPREVPAEFTSHSHDRASGLQCREVGSDLLLLTRLRRVLQVHWRLRAGVSRCQPVSQFVENHLIDACKLSRHRRIFSSAYSEGRATQSEVRIVPNSSAWAWTCFGGYWNYHS